MARIPGTNGRGGGFSPVEKLAVWEKGKIIAGHNPAMFRRDACGSLIAWSQYGVTIVGECGWEIDHIMPVVAGGGDQLSNLQPLQWQNNRAKGDHWPRWSCAT